MPWSKIDDQFYDHPKTVAAGPLGIALFVCGLSYCSRYLTDGFILSAQVRRLINVDDPLEVAEHLVEVGLWERHDGGYQVHDYHKYELRAPSALWLGLRAEIMHRDGHTCQYCGAAAQHIDHIVPRCQGGIDDPGNLVAACARCNLTKGGRTPEQAGMELHCGPR